MNESFHQTHGFSLSKCIIVHGSVAVQLLIRRNFGTNTKSKQYSSNQCRQFGLKNRVACYCIYLNTVM